MPKYQLEQQQLQPDRIDQQVAYAARAFSPPDQEPHLEFPEHVSLSQRYRLLGNSLNCWVVSELLRCELFEW